MDASFSIRPATSDDLPLVLQIENKVHPAPWTETHFKSELEKPYSHFLIMTDDETDSVVAAYIVFWLMLDECQVLDVAVDFPYRGMGFAKQLLRQAVKAALQKGIGKVLLDVRKSNEAAIHLYQGLGFVIASIHKSFYSNGEDAYQMRLDLNGNRIEF